MKTHNFRDLREKASGVKIQIQVEHHSPTDI